jgi:hypothetical protein
MARSSAQITSTIIPAAMAARTIVLLENEYPEPAELAVSTCAVFVVVGVAVSLDMV